MARKSRKIVCDGLLVEPEAGRKGAEIVVLVSSLTNKKWDKKAARMIHDRVTDLEARLGPGTAVEACACALIVMRKMLSRRAA